MRGFIASNLSIKIMMRRVISTGVKRAYSSSSRVMAESAAAATGAQMKVNFCTPHAAVYKDKAVEQVVLPGAAGVFGVTMGHSPIISQLEPGVVTVIHVGVGFYFILQHATVSIGFIKISVTAIL